MFIELRQIMLTPVLCATTSIRLSRLQKVIMGSDNPRYISYGCHSTIGR